MIQISDIQTLLGDTFFEGSGDVVGLIIFALAMVVFTRITKDSMILVVLLLPLMLILGMLGVISSTILFIMIIVMVLVLALKASSAFFGE